MNDVNIPKKSKLNAYAVEWIKNNLFPIKGNSNIENSYGLKHKFQHATGIYMFNGEFKHAMSEAGFEPINENDKNWRYRISRKSPGLDWVGNGRKVDRHKQRYYTVEGWKPIDVEETGQRTLN